MCADLTLSADDSVDAVYLNGLQVLLTTTPILASSYLKYSVTAMPARLALIAVRLHNDVGLAGFIASSSTGSTNTVLTNKNWKCTNSTPSDNWYTSSYDDSLWLPAVEIGLNGCYTDGCSSTWSSYLKDVISSSAYWIWTASVH